MSMGPGRGLSIFGLDVALDPISASSVVCEARVQDPIARTHFEFRVERRLADIRCTC